MGRPVGGAVMRLEARTGVVRRRWMPLKRPQRACRREKRVGQGVERPEAFARILGFRLGTPYCTESLALSPPQGGSADLP